MLAVRKRGGRLLGPAAAAALAALAACAEVSQPPATLPADLTANLAEAARQAEVLSASPAVGNANRRAAEVAVQYAVLRGIAEYPAYAGPIVAEIVRLSPAYGPSARAAAMATYPAFAPAIAAAVSGTPYAPTGPQPVVGGVASAAWEPGAPAGTAVVAAPPSQPWPIYAEAAPAQQPQAWAPASSEPSALPFGVTELWLGVMAHDLGVFGRSKEDSGPDVDFGVRFEPLEGEFWNLIANPRPLWGFHVNTRGDTSQMFGGIGWQFPIWDGFFFGADFGLALHDGKLTSSRLDEKELGLRLLFREAAEFGYRLNEHHAVSVVLDHISNGRLGDANDGLDNLGLRYTYRH